MTYCSSCAHWIDASPDDLADNVGWCPHCRNVFRSPVFSTPGWVMGVLAFLLLRQVLLT